MLAMAMENRNGGMVSWTFILPGIVLLTKSLCIQLGWFLFLILVIKNSLSLLDLGTYIPR